MPLIAAWMDRVTLMLRKGTQREQDRSYTTDRHVLETYANQPF